MLLPCIFPLDNAAGKGEKVLSWLRATLQDKGPTNSPGAARRSAPACSSSSFPEMTVPGGAIPVPWAGLPGRMAPGRPLIQITSEVRGQWLGCGDALPLLAPLTTRTYKAPGPLIPETTCARGAARLAPLSLQSATA